MEAVSTQAVKIMADASMEIANFVINCQSHALKQIKTLTPVGEKDQKIFVEIIEAMVADLGAAKAAKSRNEFLLGMMRKVEQLGSEGGEEVSE